MIEKHRPSRRNKTILLTLFTALILFTLSAVHIPISLKADNFQVRKTLGHWHLSCGKPPGAQSERCALVQDVTDETRPNYSLRVIFLKARSDGKEILRVVAPLGVLLPTGLGLKVDGKDIGHAPFMRCSNIGCIAEVVLDGTIVTQFKTGGTAVFIIFQTPEEGIGFPVSLKGFTAAYKTLQE